MEKSIILSIVAGNVKHYKWEGEMKMKKITKRWMAALTALMLCVGMFCGSVVPVYASMADEAIPYTMGETYRGQHYYNKYYSFTLKERTHIFLRTEVGGGTVGYCIYNSSGRQYLDSDNVRYKHNVTTDVYVGTASRTLPAGTYYLEIESNSTEYYFALNADKTIVLAKGSITSLKSKKSGQITVSCKSVPNAIGYRIQYSTDYRFRKGVKTIYSPVRIKTLTRLAKGKRYYVRVTPYTVYTDGEHAWGGTSYVKSAVAKK